MELVEFVHRHEIEHAFNLVDGEEVARYVEHEAAIGEAGAVGDGQTGGVRNGVTPASRTPAATQAGNILLMLAKA